MTRGLSLYAILLILAGLLSHPISVAIDHFANHVAEVLSAAS